jgi:hypothetical protein
VEASGGPEAYAARRVEEILAEKQKRKKSRRLTSSRAGATLPPNSREDSMEAEQPTEAATEQNATPEATTLETTEPAKPKRARKPRQPRKKKAEPVEAPAAAPPPAPLPPEALAPIWPTESQASEPACREDAAEPPISDKPAVIHAKPELMGAKPRKSGRRAWDINLGQGEHVWERVTTPDNQIVFRFKMPATDGQHDLIARFGFAYDPERKEARRPDDAAGRVYTDKLAWYLKQGERSRGAARTA